MGRGHVVARLDLNEIAEYGGLLPYNVVKLTVDRRRGGNEGDPNRFLLVNVSGRK